MQVSASRKIVAFGPSVGQYQGRDIPAWFETADGRTSSYVGVSGAVANLDTLLPGQSVIAPGLVYQEDCAVGDADIAYG